MACNCKCNKTKGASEEKVREAMGEYPGMAIDASDDCRTTGAEVKERTHTLNNNPRNTDDEMPG